MKSQSTLTISIDNTSLSADKNYDVFVYDNSGTLTLALVAWTNDTTRATTLDYVDGWPVYVNSGDETRRYVGTVRTITSTGVKFTDTEAQRFTWNYYNRVRRPMKAATETTNSWTYTTDTFRQSNANTANQLEYVQGVSEDMITASAMSTAVQTSPQICSCGIGVDSTTTSSALNMGNTVSNFEEQIHATYQGFPGAGYHYLAWLERSVASGTTTWYGDANSPAKWQSGIWGEVWA